MWSDFKGVSVFYALKRGFKVRKNDGFRWRIETMITYYHMWLLVNDKSNKWRVFLPEWLCILTGHWSVDCNNHYDIKPEHDQCTWCEKSLPYTANLSQPISYWRHR